MQCSDLSKQLISALVAVALLGLSACTAPANNPADTQVSAQAPTVAVPAADMTLGGDVFAFSGYFDQTNPNVQVEEDRIVIDTRFVASLLETPDGALFDANRNELLYLIARNDLQAVGAGFVVLAELLRNPQFYIEGDRQYQRYGKEELAFALSRTSNAPLVLCRLADADRVLVLAFYQQNSMLWRNSDPPWQVGNLVCEDV